MVKEFRRKKVDIFLVCCNRFCVKKTLGNQNFELTIQKKLFFDIGGDCYEK